MAIHHRSDDGFMIRCQLAPTSDDIKGFLHCGQSSCTGPLARAANKNEVRAGPELRRNRSPLASGNYEVIGVTRSQGFQGEFLSRRLCHSQVPQKAERLLGPYTQVTRSSKADVGGAVGKVPREGGSELDCRFVVLSLDFARCWIVKDNLELALILASKFPDHH